MTENDMPQVSEQELKGRRFAYLCYAVFTDALGKELMKHLDTLSCQPVAPHTETSAYAYFREGQNDIIRRLKAGIELHAQSMRGEHDRRSPSNPID